MPAACRDQEGTLEPWQTRGLGFGLAFVLPPNVTASIEELP